MGSKDLAIFLGGMISCIIWYHDTCIMYRLCIIALEVQQVHAIWMVYKGEAMDEN